MAETIKNGTYKIRATTRSELARQYQVCLKTLNAWIDNFPELKIKRTKTILTPSEVRAIIEKIGEP